MIRKAIIGMLTLAAAGMGMISAVKVPGCSSGVEQRFGKPEAGPYSSVMVMSGRGIILITYAKYLEGSRLPRQRQRWRGPGWLFVSTVGWNEPMGRPFRGLTLVVSWTIPVAMSALLATYPTIAVIRGPLRRRRQTLRRRKGLCVTCGYDLTGNVTGICSECGRTI